MLSKRLLFTVCAILFSESAIGATWDKFHCPTFKVQKVCSGSGHSFDLTNMINNYVNTCTVGTPPLGGKGNSFMVTCFERGS